MFAKDKSLLLCIFFSFEILIYYSATEFEDIVMQKLFLPIQTTF